MNLTDELINMTNMTQQPYTPAPPITLPPQALGILGKIGQFCSSAFSWLKAMFVKVVPMDIIVIAAMILFGVVIFWLLKKLLSGKK